MQLTFRNAQPADARLYFDWANDALTRQQSFNTNPITWENHVAWFSRKLADPNALLFVFEAQPKQSVGQVRFERSNDEVIIGLSLDAAFRGKGLAPKMLQMAVDAYRVQSPPPNLPIHAYIRPDNTASIKSFERAGFRLSHESDKFNTPSIVYTI